MFRNQNAAILFWWIASCLLHLSFAEEGRPIILVPGLAENEIQASVFKSAAANPDCGTLAGDNFVTVYPNAALLSTPESNACLEQLLSLRFNSREISSRPREVRTRVPGFGDPVYVEWRTQQDHSDNSSYFITLVSALVSEGYRRGVTIFGAPYDFRKSPQELLNYFDKLTELIEAAHTANCKKPVVLVGHQYGAILMTFYLNHVSPRWKNKYIHAFVSLSAPWGGMLSTVESILSGPSLRSLFRTWPSVYTMLPTTITWSEGDDLVFTPQTNYSVGNMEQLLRDLNLNDGFRTWQKVRSVLYRLDAPGVDFYCFHGQNTTTTFSATFTGEDFPDGKPSATSFGDGDGSVRLDSLQACEMWRTRQQLMGKQFLRTAFLDVEHRAIVQDSNVINAIINIASDNSWRCNTELALII